MTLRFRIAVGILLLFGVVLMSAPLWASERYDIEAEAHHGDMYRDHELKKHVLEFVDDWSIPLDTKNLVIERLYDKRGYNLVISLDYSIELDFFKKYQKVLYFEIEALGPLRTDD